MNDLNPRQRDRALGAILGAALADAVGAPYEFSTASPGVELGGGLPDLVGGGVMNWGKGEWTDDTAMAVPLLRVLAAGADLESESALDEISAQWTTWAQQSKDVGVQTKRVLAEAQAPLAAALRASAKAVHDATGKSGGNGSLMRTAPVALACLLQEDGQAATARIAAKVSSLTHWDHEAAEACVIWSLAIRAAILGGVVDVPAAVHAARAEWTLSEDREALWLARIAEATASEPAAFPKNGWVVHAFQAAVASLARGGVLAKDESGGAGARYVRSIEAAINAAGDTDTVACIAGALAGAEVGASVLPFPWVRAAHGWPDMTAQDLAGLVAKAVAATASGASGSPGASSQRTRLV